MSLPGPDEAALDLGRRIVELERDNRLLKHGLGQLTRIREQWTRALDELRDTKSRLQATNRFLDRLLHTAPLPVLVVSMPWGRILMANAAAEALAGVPAGGLGGRNAVRLLSTETRGDLLRELGAAGAAPVAVTLRGEGGEARHLELHASAVGAAPGEPERLVVIAQDVTERWLAEERLRHQSLHDVLTGLPNRLLFREHLKRALTLCERYEQKVAVMFLDLDGFKYVNDAYGHDTGDELLREVGTRLRGVLRASDTIARFGGDEFAAILLGVTEVSDVERVARKVINAISTPYLVNGWICNVSASVGISLYPDDAEAPSDLMKYADMAMYRVKAAGKSGYQLFTPDMSLEVLRRMESISRLQSALERGEIEVHYQPQVDIAQRRILGFEALARWNDPARGLLPPADFIGLAEETGLIDALGECVLEAACRQVAAWAREGITGISMAVNLSSRELRHDGLVDRIHWLIQDTGIDPAVLVIEVTESTVMEDLAAATRIFADLRRLGVRFALDDFGTGYASMACLQRLPFSQIKIERQFIRDLETDAQDVAIADAIIRMAAALGLSVVAEGIETAGQLRLLEGLKCEQAQGFYFAPPTAAEECRRLLATERPGSLADVPSLADLSPSSRPHWMAGATAIREPA